MHRSRAIDILRAVAVLLVMGRHLDRCPTATSSTLHWFTNLWQIGGWVGVDLFFVLSGFLVSGLLFREYEKHGVISLKSFLIRRGFKIYPAFWLLLLVTLIIAAVTGRDYKMLAVPCELLFLQNYGPALWNHTWSLAVEEHFYLFLVLLLFALLKWRHNPNPFRIVPTLFACLAITCLGLRLATEHVTPVFSDKTNLFPTHLRMDSLFCGVTLSYYYHTYPVAFMAWARRWRWPLMGLGLLALSPAFLYDIKTTPYIYTFGLTQFYLGGACLLVALLGLKLPENWLVRSLSHIGSHSYSIYLWLMAWLTWIVPLISGASKADRHWPLYAVTYLGGGILFGIGIAAVIEFPLLRLRDRWFPSRSRALETGK